MRALLGHMHSLLGRHKIAVKFCVALRNQVNAVIGNYLGESSHPQKNGEQLLARSIAPQSESFIDVGANCGDWTAMWLRLAMPTARGTLFEPSSKTFSRLRSRFGNNMQLTLINKAAGDAPGMLTFRHHAAFDEKSTLVNAAKCEPGDTVETVEITTLDLEFGQRGIPSIDFLKIDAEGFDARVLKGSRNLLDAQRIRLLQFEYGGIWAAAGSTLTETVSFLESCGYETYLLRSDGLHHFDLDKFGEFYRYANFVAVRRSDRQWLSQQIKISHET